jgi:hypothetical protein
MKQYRIQFVSGDLWWVETAQLPPKFGSGGEWMVERMDEAMQGNDITQRSMGFWKVFIDNVEAIRELS